MGRENEKPSSECWGLVRGRYIAVIRCCSLGGQIVDGRSQNDATTSRRLLMLLSLPHFSTLPLFLFLVHYVLGPHRHMYHILGRLIKLAFYHDISFYPLRQHPPRGRDLPSSGMLSFSNLPKYIRRILLGLLGFASQSSRHSRRINSLSVYTLML